MKKAFRGLGYAIASVPQAAMSLPRLVLRHLHEGNFYDPALTESQGSPYSELTQDLGDRLTEYELVEDLISRLLRGNIMGYLDDYMAGKL